MPQGFINVPDWFSSENEGAGIAVADVTGNGRPDLVVFMIDNPVGQNQGFYRIGRDLDAGGDVTDGWGPWIAVPDWFSSENQGGGIALADITGNGRLDLLVFMIDNPGGQNRGVYRVGTDLDAGGNVNPGNWGPWTDVPDWFSFENQGGGIALADITGNGRLDLVVFMIDNPGGQNRGVYRVGRDLDGGGNVAPGNWGPWTDVPDWFSFENQGGGVAVADVTGNGKPDIIVFAIDNAPTQNQGLYRVGHDIDANGVPTGPPETRWGTWLGVPNWFSWENQFGGIAFATAGAAKQLFVLMVDNPPGQNGGFYTLIRLDNDPRTQGTWEVLDFNSQVLAIHAALLRTGKVLFFSGSGNNQVRAHSPDFGDVAKGIFTSVLWDPATPSGANFFHPPTHIGLDGKPFDFFCGGDTCLADGTLLSAGGNLAYPGKGRRDVAAFDPVTEQWSGRAMMAQGRWYPTLLPLGDGRILAVSGLNEAGTLNTTVEIYDPGANAWHQLHVPEGGLFFGFPLYAHLFLLADGRVFFSGGRMDDASPQGPVFIDLTTQPIGITGVPGLDDPATRNQSASVLLPPAQQQKVMIIGGGPEDASNATGSTAIVDLTSGQPQYRPAAPMSLPRMHLNSVLLPDHTVFVSGGALKRETAQVARLESEIYDPATDNWRVAATASVVRMYHSVALLLPDARVITASGNPPPYGDKVPWEPADPNEELRLEMYTPPYLFAGPRPVIGKVPTEWRYGQTVTIASAQAGGIKWVSIVRNGVTTHAFDNSQRLVDLDITGQGGGTITATVTNQPNIAPPGWYMLFLVDTTGVPSVATWIHLAQ
jgi:hypothetical protein